jgi:MFS family permease
LGGLDLLGLLGVHPNRQPTINRYQQSQCRLDTVAVAMSTPAPKEIYNKHIYLIALVASMGAFMFGYDLAFIGTTITLKPFKHDFGLLHASEATSDAFSANIVSLLQAGCFFGSLAVAPLGDRFGRRPALMIAGVTFCIGSLMQTVSFGLVSVMYIGRAIGGLVSLSVYLYLGGNPLTIL